MNERIGPGMMIALVWTVPMGIALWWAIYLLWAWVANSMPEIPTILPYGGRA